MTTNPNRHPEGFLFICRNRPEAETIAKVVQANRDVTLTITPAPRDGNPDRTALSAELPHWTIRSLYALTDYCTGARDLYREIPNMEDLK